MLQLYDDMNLALAPRVTAPVRVRMCAICGCNVRPGAVLHAMAVVKAAGLPTKFSLRTADTAALGHGLTGADVRQHYLDLGFTVFMESGAY